MNGANVAAGPIVSDSVAGTDPPTSPEAGTPTEIGSVSMFAQLCPCAMYFGALDTTPGAFAATVTAIVIGG